MVDMNQFRQTFFDECYDCLAALEVQLVEFQVGRAADESVEDAFRAIHSIKGGAGAFGFSRIIAVAHAFETVLDRIRNREIDLTPVLNAALLRAFDVLTDLVVDERAGLESTIDQEAAVLEELARFADGDRTDISGSTPETDPPSRSGTEGDAPETTGPRCYRIEFRPSPTMLERGNEPLLLFRELKTLGALRVEADLSGLPSLADMDPMESCLGWTLHLETDSDREAVDEIFEFVEGDCALEIRDVEPAGGGTDVQTPMTRPKATIDEPSRPQKTDTQRPSADYSSVRVDLERVDRMVNMVGEIVIAQAAIMQQVDDALNESHPQLVESLQQFMRHTQNLQDSVMAIRAQPVKLIFGRMPRLVRELSRQTGKAVRLEITGEETEIDKTVIEKLADPLNHMIRNAIDHGIEMPEKRLAAGKPETGELRLSAQQRGSQIIIELTDDGRGLDRQAIRRKALERGLISPDADLSEQDIDNLIFRPGFSTVDTVSDISGRGVGMDVVHDNIRKLGGRVAIRSEDGKGSKITLVLPLTLAVMDGMVVRIGPTIFIVPLTSIIESLALDERAIAHLPGHGEVLRFRNAYLKVFDLRKLFGFATMEDRTPLLMVVETDHGEAIGLRVDEIIGQQQVVVKKIEDGVSASACVAGGSIMGNGEGALILDAGGLNSLEAARWTDERPKPENAAA